MQAAKYSQNLLRCRVGCMVLLSLIWMDIVGIKYIWISAKCLKPKFFSGLEQNTQAAFFLFKLMKIAVIIVRVLIGLMFLMASVTYFLNVAPPPVGLSAESKTFFEGMAASKYILPVAKFIELLTALAFLSGRFVALGVILIFPIAFNILLINAIHLPNGLWIAIPLFLGILFLAFTESEKFMPLLELK